jgi:hypothetical protein
VRVASIVFITCTRIVAVAGAVTVAVAIVTTEAGPVTVAADAGPVTVAADAGPVTVAADTGTIAVTVTDTPFVVIGLICRFNIYAPTHWAGGITISPCVL